MNIEIASSTHTHLRRPSRAARLRAGAALLLLGALGAACTAGAGAEVEAESLGVASLRGTYDLTSSYTGTIGDTRGWIIEWEIPELLNESTAWTAIGQWYYNLESGIYHSPDGWFVYYYGDDDGVTGNHPDCTSLLPSWGSGSTCGGSLGDLEPGQQVVFKYEWCTPERVASVSGSKLCLYVDMKDGAGWQFLAQDERTTVEMYAHDIEHFADVGPQYPEPQVSCEAPIKMLRQELKTTAGVWQPMSGASTWSFHDAAPYIYQNENFGASPSTWEACTSSGNDCSGVPAWTSAQVYSPSTLVTDGGHLWSATQQIWWSHPNCPPSNPDPWCPAEWADLGPCN
ncbi:hypothetical protein SOCEGT47_003500 [Sorangium cellulosum]|uniref:Chitin-binding type-3 domain-containing protein n=1 Tax=Sorangium cellulosum TaxID=56 RepID=A0A4P2PU38_SORCE|nr:hypothetical protein [Sorangium cellulosum]AUX19896.1 hypothetical protein SOCEGT47_003500 [Sorangium cellulosum]